MEYRILGFDRHNICTGMVGGWKMFNTNVICNTCKHKHGKTFTAPISKKRIQIYSCSTFPLGKDYDYKNNFCSNYEKEVEDVHSTERRYR